MIGAKLNNRMWWKRVCTLFLLCAATVIVSPAQTFTRLVNFDATNGAYPSASLVQATNGDLYGTTVGGGTGFGTIFKVTPAGTLTTLHNFDGANPYAGLVQATNGSFYGETYGGGTYNDGTIFKSQQPAWLTTLYSFDLTDGGLPVGGLVQATDGYLYGTTWEGGANGYGTIFKITPAGELTTLYSFCMQSGCADGIEPDSGLIQATDGNFYGTTYSGGIADGPCDGTCGTIVKITPGGELTTLHSFDLTDGEFIPAELVQDINGRFYGTTYEGGANGDGTVFSLSVGLGAFVKTLPTIGVVGETIHNPGIELERRDQRNFQRHTSNNSLRSPDRDLCQGS